MPASTCGKAISKAVCRSSRTSPSSRSCRLKWATASPATRWASIRTAPGGSVRAPNLQELFVEKGLVLEGATDPCDSSTSSPATALQCARTGLTAAQTGHVLSSPAGQYNGLTGGNPNLKPETSDTTSF